MVAIQDEMRTDPPAGGALLYLVALLVVLASAPFARLLWPFATLALIVLYHGTHEAVHCTLWPRKLEQPGVRRQIAFVANCLGFSVVGHNFLLLRWSHTFHHTHGRDAVENTIDGAAAGNRFIGKLQYFAGLFGWSYWYHIGLGYLYLFPSEWHIVDRKFKPRRFGPAKYLGVQILSGAVLLGLIWVSHGWYLISISLFGVYWGTMQNVAHYGLEIGAGSLSFLASRSYRVPRWLEFMFFRGGYFHLEHHAFPRVPGLLLNQRAVQTRLRSRLGIAPIPRIGFASYVSDVFRQFSGPVPRHTDPRPWYTKLDVI